MKEELKEELKEEGENNESFIGALIAKFRERDDSGDDERDAFTIIEQEEDAFSKTTKTSDAKTNRRNERDEEEEEEERERERESDDRPIVLVARG